MVGTATSYAGGGRGTGASQPVRPRPAQGGLVVAPSHPPPLTIPASGQTAGAAPPSRRLTRAASAPSAAKAARSARPRPRVQAAQTMAAAHASHGTTGTWPGPPTPARYGRNRHADTADSPTRTPSAGHTLGSPPAGPGPHGPQPGTPRRSTGKAIRWPRWQTPPWTLPEPQLLWEGPLLVQDARILPAPTSPSQISAAVPLVSVLSQSRR